MPPLLMFHTSNIERNGVETERYEHGNLICFVFSGGYSGCVDMGSKGCSGSVDVGSGGCIGCVDVGSRWFSGCVDVALVR